MSATEDKLNWLAFRYVANELDAAEASEFESLLATDQAAREAVAKAVKETTQIRQALTGPVVTVATRRTGWSHKTTQAAVGSCLTLLLALLLVRSSLPVPGGVARQANENDRSVSPAQLAYAWAETRSGSTELQSSANAMLTDSLDAILIAAVESDPEESLLAPSWMLAALEKMNGGIDSDIEMQE